MGRFRSIRSRIVAIILTASLFSAVSGLVAVTLLSGRELRRRMVEETMLQAKLAADYSVSALAFSDREAAADGIAKLREIPGLEAVALYDRDGARFAAWGAEPPPYAAAPQAPEFATGALFVTAPIDFRGERFGVVRLRASTGPLTAQLRRQQAALALLLLAMAGLTLLLAIPLARLIEQPVSELAELAGRISADGDYTRRIEESPVRELGEMGRQFNRMLEAIQSHEKARDLADRRSREKSLFLANMSHELRTPLNSIIGFSQILADRLTSRLEPREVKFLHNIHTAGQHLLGIVNDILDISKVEAGRMELVREAVTPVEVVESVATLITGMARRRAIRVETVVQGPLAPLWADPVKLKQILYNLLSNAIKFSPEGSTVRLVARELREGGHGAVEFSVRDEGIGIEPADQARIFEAFQQADGGEGRQFEGTGLGLTLVKTFAELHGGRVGLESAPGRGSRFTIVIPRVAPPAGAQGAA